MEVLIIKVASMGLEPKKHLGMRLTEIFPVVRRLVNFQFFSIQSYNSLFWKFKKYQTNVCGEGGEFESLVLDCSIFKKRLQIQEYEVIFHDDNEYA